MGLGLCPKHLFVPKNNHWLKRGILVFAFILLDYLSTLVFCRAPHEEANVLARFFMEKMGIFSGVTLFVPVFNLPIYVIMILDSHVVRFPPKIAVAFEALVDIVFAWFVAGLHFSGGASWFWSAPDAVRQVSGAAAYLVLAFLIVRPHRPRYDR
jgi:hypothetical protein